MTLKKIAQYSNLIGWEAIGTDGTYFYGGYQTNLYKVDIATMTQVGAPLNLGGLGFIESVIWDGTYLYVAYNPGNGQVFQIDTTTMTVHATWNGTVPHLTHGLALAYDVNNIYISVARSGAPLTGHVEKIAKATMLTVVSWDGVAGQFTSQSITCFGGYFYVALQMTPGTVIQVNTATMLTAGTWHGPEVANWYEYLTNDGTYLYIAHAKAGAPAGTTPNVIKVDPATMTEVAHWNGVVSSVFEGITYSNSYLYVLSDEAPGYLSNVVRQIDTASMTEVASWTGVGADEQYSYAITSTGNLAFLGFDGFNPGEVPELSSSGPITKFNRAYALSRRRL
jgi:hypothetical protein